MTTQTRSSRTPNSPKILRVLVYGANTSIGNEIVLALALLGHSVVAANVGSVHHLKGHNIACKSFSLSDEVALKEAIEETHAVVCALYPAQNAFSFTPTLRYSNAVRLLHKAGARRLLVTSSAAMDNPGLFQNMLRWADVDTHIDLARMETVLEEAKGNCDFTIVRLPMLTDDSTKSFIVEEDTVKKGRFRIGVKDAALFVVRELEQSQWLHRFPVPTY